MSGDKRPRPPQGTHGNIRSVRRAKEVKTRGARMAEDMMDVIACAEHDPEVAAYAEAQRERNMAEVGRLLPVLRERYTGKVLLRWHKTMGWRVP